MKSKLNPVVLSRITSAAFKYIEEHWDGVALLSITVDDDGGVVEACDLTRGLFRTIIGTVSQLGVTCTRTDMLSIAVGSYSIYTSIHGVVESPTDKTSNTAQTTKKPSLGVVTKDGRVKY